MKRRVGLVRICVFGALLSSTALVLPSVQAQAAEFPVKAPAAEPIPYWWFHGEVEVGGRFFLNDPQRNGRADLGQSSLAKYYEYSTIKPGPFSNIWLSTGTSDGLYQVDFGAKNIGYSDQAYYLDFSQAGKHYVSLGWDQTPHVYSMSASTPFNVNGNQLTFDQSKPGCTLPITTGPGVIPCEHTTDIGIQRDTASLQYRWTPDDVWDVKGDYSHMRRTGTQIAGIVSGSFSPVQLPRPVADSTQNYGLNGEYVGTSFWGQKVVARAGYFGSQYTDDYAAYTVQNPFVTIATDANPTLNQISTPPSNQANGFNGTIAADLPWKSRYAGTISYNMMRQDAAFIPMSTQAIYPLPAASLNGQINTFLSNNVLTTKITPELTSKASYRYYDFQNNTPELFFGNWIRGDRQTANDTNHNVNSLSINYIKQNAGEELVWRPSREWTVGAAYGFERFDYTRVDADVTNEHSGKVFADWKPASWYTARASGSFADRRYVNYDYLNFVGNFQFPPNLNDGTSRYQSSYRQLMISNRQQWKANFAVDLVVAPGLTVTPTFKYLDENYSVNPLNQQGLEDRRLWSAGIDMTYAFNRDTSVMIGYERDFVTQLLFGTSCINTTNTGTSAGCTASPTSTPGILSYTTLTNDRAIYDTVTAVVRHAAIPDKLDTELRYVASRAEDNLELLLGNGANPTGGLFPKVTTWYQRLDASATYKFDKEQIARLGWTGQVKAKIRYAWERNSVSWWATDIIGLNQGGTANILMAADNPNYNVHLVAVSLAYAW